MPVPIPDSFQPRSLMVVVAHPDDAEFMVAGTVAKWAKHGCAVTYVIVTRGDKGSDDPTMTSSKLTEIREAEQREAGAILGVKRFEFMGYPDGYLQHTLDLRRDITRLVRKHRPEVLVTFDPTHRFVGDSYVNHPDHRTTGDAAIDAVFPSARDRLTFPELLVDGLEPWKVQQLWLGFAAQPNICVDISDSIEAKRAALAAHPSQFGDDIHEFVIGMARNDAREHEFEFGESFHRITLDAPVHETEPPPVS